MTHYYLMCNTFLNGYFVNDAMKDKFDIFGDIHLSPLINGFLARCAGKFHWKIRGCSTS